MTQFTNHVQMGDAQSRDALTADALTADALAEERELMLAFAPLHKAAMGVAFGAVLALLLALLTAVAVRLAPAAHLPLELLDEYFYGYTVSWPGVAVAAFWGGLVGFVAGWFLAFARNLVVAIWMFYVRTRAELEATRDFLDHV